MPSASSLNWRARPSLHSRMIVPPTPYSGTIGNTKRGQHDHGCEYPTGSSTFVSRSHEDDRQDGPLKHAGHERSEQAARCSRMLNGDSWNVRSLHRRLPVPEGSVGMQLGMIGLGRMGSNMVRRLICGQHECWSMIFNRKRSATWSRRAPWELTHSPIV